MTVYQKALVTLGFILVVLATIMRVRVYYRRYKEARDFMEKSVADMNAKIEDYYKKHPNDDTMMEKARQDHYEYFMKERDALKNNTDENKDSTEAPKD